MVDLRGCPHGIDLRDCHFSSESGSRKVPRLETSGQPRRAIHAGTANSRELLRDGWPAILVAGRINAHAATIGLSSFPFDRGRSPWAAPRSPCDVTPHLPGPGAARAELSGAHPGVSIPGAEEGDSDAIRGFRRLVSGSYI